MLTKHVGKGKIPGFTFYVYDLRVTQYSCNIDQAYSVGGWILAKFLIISLFLWTETGEVNENAKKKNEADMQPSSADTARFGHSTSYHDMTKKRNKSC